MATSINDTATGGLYSKLFPKPQPKAQYIARATGSMGIYIAGQTEFSSGGLEILSGFIQFLVKDGWEVTGKNPNNFNYQLKRREK